jgi:hypothetical protein
VQLYCSIVQLLPLAERIHGGVVEARAPGVLDHAADLQILSIGQT